MSDASRVLRPVVAAMAALLAAPMAHATLVSGSYSFVASGYAAGAPVDPVVGSVHFSFDNSANFFGAANGAMANAAPVQVSFSGLNLPGSWTPVLTYLKDAVVNGVPVHDLMAIGHALNGTPTLPGTDDWRLALNNVSSGPSFREFTYTLANAPGTQFQSFNGRISPVPEPQNLALLAIGLLALGRRGSRRTASAEAAVRG